MELESQNGISGAVSILTVSILDASAEALGSQERLPHAKFLRASAAALLALGALSIPIHASATTTVFATVPGQSITAAPTGFPGSYLVTDGNNSVNGNIDVLAANGKSVSAFTPVPNIIEPSEIAFAPRNFGKLAGTCSSRMRRPRPFMW
jgi:hypothetical protein